MNSTEHGPRREIPATGLFAAAAGLFLVVAAVYLFGAWYSPLAEPDETRYAEIAREMLVLHDWITPHLNFVKYFEKPPLVYWGSALAYLSFGVNEVAARLPAILSALGGVLLVFFLALDMYGRAEAVLAALILATAPAYSILGQTLILDMPLSFFMTAAMAGVWFGCRRDSRPWYRFAWAAVAAGVLVKGPVAAVLVAVPALIFLVLHGGWRALRPAADLRGIGLAALIALPWFALVSWINPEFPRYFIVDQHLKRFLWTHEHGQPFWYFLPQLPAMLFPWALVPLLDPGLWWSDRDPRRWSAATRFLVLWAAAVVGFFSLSSSKLMTYVLPALAPLAILVARVLVCGVGRGRSAGLWRLAFLLLVVGLGTGLAGAIVPLVSKHWRVPLIVPYLYLGGLILAGTGFAMRAALRRVRPRQCMGTLAVGAVLLLGLSSVGHSLVKSYDRLGHAAQAAMRQGDRLAVYRHLVHGMGFYTGRRVIMVIGRGELGFGSRQGDHGDYFWPDDDTLRREWAGPGRLFLTINRKELLRLRPPLDPPPITLAIQGKKLLVVNRGGRP